MKVLLAIDGSSYSEHAVQYVLTHLHQLGEGLKLTLMYVNLPLPAHVASALGKESVEQYYQDESNKAASKAKQLLDGKGVKFQQVVGKGEPGEEVARYAQEQKFDLIVMGSKGHGALHNLVLGSTVNRVLAACPVPLLIIH